MCLLASRPLQAFSLLGPLESWQTQAFGYNVFNNDIGGPKNLGEEYRWNASVITYGFDNSFLNYFGNEGVAAVDAAFAVLNSLPDLTSLSSNLSEFPLVDPATGASTSYRDARRINLRAEADSLIDLKSTTLGMVIEQLGLASPERWTWAIADRKITANNTATQYLTIQRNFDPTSYAPSKYVNGNRYTYEVDEFAAPVQYVDAIEATVDPEQRIHSYSSVANITGGDTLTLLPGVFYTYLTRDDIGGLRYLYNANNLNWEGFPANTQVFTVDRSNGFISLTNQDLTLLSLRSLTSTPELMENFYPGLIITQATPNLSTIQSNIPVVVTQTVSLLFTTNYQSPVVVSNIDLATFSSITLTSAPANLTANLQAAFPGAVGLDQLVILSTNYSATTLITPQTVYLTNLSQPWLPAFVTNFVFRTNYSTNIQILYHYAFQNVRTNAYSPLKTVREVVVGLDLEPWSTPLSPVYKTRIKDIVEDGPSGSILIIPTNLVDYVFTGFNITNVVGITNFTFTTNFTDLNSGLLRTVSRSDYILFTNVQYFAYPIQFLANPLVTNVFVTNAFVTTNIITYSYAYGNILTNYAGPSTPGTRSRYQVTVDPANPLATITNVLSLEATTLPVPSGGFILDTNQTGFQFSGFSNVVAQAVTNIVFDITDVTGVRTVEQFVYVFTNTTYLVFPYTLVPAPTSVLRPGVSKLKFQRIGGTVFNGNSFAYTNRYTASYYTNGVLTNAVFVQVQTQPDILIRARDLGRTAVSVVPLEYTRNGNFQNNAALNSSDPAQAGPGTIGGVITLDFNKIGPSLINQFPGFITEASSLNFGFQPFFWGSFDGSTNPPTVFPKDITLESIEVLKTGGAVP